MTDSVNIFHAGLFTQAQRSPLRVKAILVTRFLTKLVKRLNMAAFKSYLLGKLNVESNICYKLIICYYIELHVFILMHWQVFVFQDGQEQILVGHNTMIKED